MSDVPQFLRSGELAGWLSDFQKLRRSQVDALLAVQCLIFLLLAGSMAQAYIYLSWSYSRPSISSDDIYLLSISIPVIWFTGAFVIRKIALTDQSAYLAELFVTHELLALGLGEELLTGGDGSSFRKRLQAMFRGLPRLLREQQQPQEPAGGPISRSVMFTTLVLLVWIAWLHFQIGIGLELPVLGGLLILMLLDYRRRLSRIVLDLAFAHYMLGSFELPPVGLAPPAPPPPPEHM